MAQFRITAQRVQNGVMYVEADNLDDAFEQAELFPNFDWDDGYIDTEMMNAEQESEI